MRSMLPHGELTASGSGQMGVRATNAGMAPGEKRVKRPSNHTEGQESTSHSFMSSDMPLKTCRTTS